MNFSFLNIVGAWFRLHWAKWRGYEVILDPVTVSWRFSRCEVCKFFDGASCSRCGCLAMAKVMLATEECPEDKWSRVWRRKTTTDKPAV
jgi:hypothetical protein